MKNKIDREDLTEVIWFWTMPIGGTVLLFAPFIAFIYELAKGMPK